MISDFQSRGQPMHFQCIVVEYNVHAAIPLTIGFMKGRNSEEFILSEKDGGKFLSDKVSMNKPQRDTRIEGK